MFLENMDLHRAVDINYDTVYGPNHNEDCRRDICRCTGIVNARVETPINTLSVAELIYKKIKTKGKPEKLRLYALERIVSVATRNPEVFDINVVKGYYGEEIGSVHLSAGDDFEKAVNDVLKEDSNPVAVALIYEYGYLLDRLVGCDFKIVTVPREDIKLGDFYPSQAYAQSRYSMEYPLPLCLIDENNLVVDGHHRMAAKNPKDKVEVVKAFPR